MKRFRHVLPSSIVMAGVMLVAPTLNPGRAATLDPNGLSTTQVATAFASMPAGERTERSKYFTDSRWVVMGYTQIWVPATGATAVQTVTTPLGSTTTQAAAPRTPATLAQTASSTYSFNGLYISIAVAWDTSIRFEYRYDIQAFFDWQGNTYPWNGVLGVDGFAIYWGNSLALLSDYFWGKYRDGTNLQNASRNEAPPNSGVGWTFWEAKNNCCSIADFGWLTATVAKANFANSITNFNVKYIHSWANLSYGFSWGSGPSVSFSPSTSSQPISTYTSLRT